MRYEDLCDPPDPPRTPRERDPEAFRCPGCETPTPGGRFCVACRQEAGDG